MPNRLDQETSPYLLQHKDNPVDWYPWGREAFQKAKEEDKPVFLSVGYSSCHWCHVMEHESFEDEEVAEVLNRSFVSIKVDREERPDVDEAYMTAVQLSSGRGGWPMSVFLTPDREPFFAGTYFPKEDRGKAAGFLSVLQQIANLWQSRRQDVLSSAKSFVDALKQHLKGRAPGTFDHLNQKLIDDCVRTLAGEFDQQNGGFGAAPKFPPHSAIEFLMNYAVSPASPQDLREAAIGISCFTLERMALGGIHDHVGGGFHRYSTDERWLLPHFEKMLYDNALLLRNYALAAGLVREIDAPLSDLFLNTARGIVEWASREMLSPEGLFYSALDADSEGEEGRYYVWTVDEVRQVDPTAEGFLSDYGFAVEGNFRDESTGTLTGANIPHLTQNAAGKYQSTLDALLERRLQRVPPSLDDKALIGWNGLMIGAMAEAGAVQLALGAARSILSAESRYGRLPHQIAKGIVSGEGYLDDYAYFAEGLLRLASYLEFLEENQSGIPGEDSAFWRSQAQRITEEMVRSFWDAEDGAFFSTTDRHEFLFGRTKPVFDQPTPSGNAVAISVLEQLGDTEKAQAAIDALLGWMQRVPQATEALHLAAMPLVTTDGPETEIPMVSQEVQVSFGPKETHVGTDGSAVCIVRIEVPAGMHLNGPNPPARWLTPTRVEVQGALGTVRYPAAPDDQYTGVLEIPVEMRLKPGEEGAEYEAKVTWQACTDSECLLPQEKTFSGVIYR